jgi:phosphoribosylanthranilate isomerase
VEKAADCSADSVLLDAGSEAMWGGTGETFDWSIAEGLSDRLDRLYLAGGLSSANVREAVRILRPHVVDVCSCIERAPGVKDETKLRDFFKAVREI